MSYSGSIKIWDPLVGPSRSIDTAHNECIYEAMWNPEHGDILASCSRDTLVKIWDTRNPNHTLHIKLIEFNIRDGDGEVLTLDWNKYQQDQIITGSVDKTLKLWDLRSPALPILKLNGHGYGIKRVRTSPYDGNLVSSVSYDMSFRLWNLSLGTQVLVDEGHTEFISGLDFSLFNPRLVMTCGWDESVRLIEF